MSATMTIPSVSDASIRRTVLRRLGRLGRSAPAAPSPRLSRQIDDAVEEVLKLAHPRVAHRTCSIAVERGCVRINASVALHGFRLAMGLAPCHTLHVYLVTLGHAVDQLIARTMRHRSGFGVVVDTAASVAVEARVAQLHREIAEDLPPDRKCSLPFSPGYCDWPLREQQKLLALLPDHPGMDVHLSEDYLLRPRKSIAGVIGIGPASMLDETGSPCQTCGRKNCPYRRER